MIRSSPKPKQSSSTKPWATPSRSRIKLAGIELVPDLSGALYIPDFATLVFSDLHLEKASSLAARGMALPPYDTRATIALLAHAVANHRPQRIVFLGDSFHDADGPTRLLGEDLDNLRRAIGGAEAIWIAGNHDPSFTFDLGGTAETLALGPISLRHEPRLRLADGEAEIAGHLHPVAAVIQRGRRLQQKCFVADEHRLVMPAFGVLTGGLNVTARPFKGLFADARFSVWMLGSERLHRFPATRLC
jgi:hypothetical protein